MVTAPSPLSRRRLLRALDTAEIQRAIERAEAGTSGEVRVSVAGVFRGDTRALAERAFHRLGMQQTRHRNGVLILLAPTRRQVVILGDQGIHARVDASSWKVLADELARRFAHQDFTAGLVETIERLGRTLAEHFPPDRGGNDNELPDTLDAGA